MNIWLYSGFDDIVLLLQSGIDYVIIIAYMAIGAVSQLWNFRNLNVDQPKGVLI